MSRKTAKHLHTGRIARCHHTIHPEARGFEGDGGVDGRMGRLMWLIKQWSPPPLGSFYWASLCRNVNLTLPETFPDHLFLKPLLLTRLAMVSEPCL